MNCRSIEVERTLFCNNFFDDDVCGGKRSKNRFRNYSIPFAFPPAVEASHAKVTQAAPIKHNPSLPFSHTAFCHCIVAIAVVKWLTRSPSNLCKQLRFTCVLQTHGMEVYGVKTQYLEMERKCTEQSFFYLALQLGLGHRRSQDF